MTAWTPGAPVIERLLEERRLERVLGAQADGSPWLDRAWQTIAAARVIERVNCVNPGTADTPWIGRLLDAADDPAAEQTALFARQPHGRLVSPREVAEAIAYLASPGAGSTAGISIDVDGGLTALRLPSAARS